MIRKLYLSALPLIAFILEILPFGAVCHFANPDGEAFRRTYSYFSLIPYGYANIFPLFTGVFTFVILFLSAVCIVKDNHILHIFTEFMSWITFAISLCPLLLGITFYSLTGLFISLSLLIQAILSHIISIRTKEK